MIENYEKKYVADQKYDCIVASTEWKAIETEKKRITNEKQEIELERSKLLKMKEGILMYTECIHN